MGDNIDSIWNSMREEESKSRKEYHSRSQAVNSGVNGSMLDIMKGVLKEKEKKPKKTKSKKEEIEKSSKNNSKSVIETKVEVDDVQIENLNEDSDISQCTKQLLSANELLQKISRDLSGSEGSNPSDRKRSLQKLYQTICVETSLTIAL
jgi:predicted DNA-binding ArsR family transcriptional regulator